MKPRIKVLNSDEIAPKLKEDLEKELLKLEKEFQKQHSPADLNAVIGEALTDAMNTDLFKDMPKELQDALRESFTGSLPECYRPDLAKVSKEVYSVLRKHRLTHYESYGVLEAIKSKIGFSAHCKKVKE